MAAVVGISFVSSRAELFYYVERMYGKESKIPSNIMKKKKKSLNSESCYLFDIKCIFMCKNYINHIAYEAKNLKIVLFFIWNITIWVFDSY